MQFAHMMIEFGFGASLLANALLFIPQIISLLKKKSSEGLSLITFLGFNVIQIFTLFHGLSTHDDLLVIGYLFSIVTCGTVSFLIAFYRLKERNCALNAAL